jgi:hypothetical protein
MTRTLKLSKIMKSRNMKLTKTETLIWDAAETKHN